MVEVQRPIFLKTVVIIVGILLVEFGAFLYFFPVTNSISGHSISDVTKLYSQISPTSKMFLMGQWIVIACILLIIFFKNRGIWRRNSEKQGLNLDSILKKSKTNLDALYTILEEKKQISIRSVCDIFKIKEDLAMEWARILEAGELATIEFPGIGSPMIVIKEKKGGGSKDKKIVDAKASKKSAVVAPKKKPKPIKGKRAAKKQIKKLLKDLKKEQPKK